jgi:hypothetical protein
MSCLYVQDVHTLRKFRCHIPERLKNLFPHLRKLYSAGNEVVPGYWECYMAEYKQYVNIPKNWTHEI